MMNAKLLSRLQPVTEEEQAILDGNNTVQRERYTSRREFVVDCNKLLEKGQLIEVRPHTRFVHFPRHRHNYVELIYMCSGSTTHVVNDAQGRTQVFTLQPGDLLFLNQAVYHEILPAKQEDIAVNFIILPQFFDRSFAMLERENTLWDFLVSTLSAGPAGSAFAGCLHFRAEEVLPVHNLIENMLWTLLERKPGAGPLNETTMGLLLLNLSMFGEEVGRRGRHEENTIFTVLNYIDTNYKDGSLAALSAQLGIPPYTLSRMVTQYTGQSFSQLMQQRKLRQAAWLLTNTSLPIETILENIGYENSSYFYRRFSERYGATPARYRRQQR